MQQTPESEVAPNPRRIRNAATSALIIVFLLTGVAWNLPDAAITRAIAPILRPIALPLGLDQSWSMYAPNPPRQQENIEVHVTMADGSDRAWTLPQLNPVLGVELSHRWRKVKETLVTDRQSRADFAHWVVRELSRPGDHPRRVEMILRTESISPPGTNEPRHTGAESLYIESLANDR
ncbi:hypothetical protein PT015_15005 [Candidatus Mycobacterium wuenschmannii]|uniref:Uncharacterized protein n=1 Tax=Candidatus Mycobacterium wuenschmannii TaxID=3027808 RepID=A0ABY8VU74_9MYCO|nr:hypothetical protein [Candidatus Mycobacterium wuenschmannii]WIM86217.1 hypothetical protein PT015_15005 [Candidatus Mycobacterium wuenschmannii]